MEGSHYGKCGGWRVGCGEGLPTTGGLRGGRVCGQGLSRDRSCARRERGDRRGFRAVRGGNQDVDVPMLASARSRYCWVRSADDGGTRGGPESAGRGSVGRPAAANSEAAGPNTHAIRTRDAGHPGSLPQNHLPGGFGGNSPRMSCCLRYHSRRVRESMVSLKSLKLAMFRAPSMSSFRDLLRSPLASVAHPR